jgi:hypothetical protein
MLEPIQKTSADIETKQIKEGDEPFVSALKLRKFEILFFRENKTHTFYCSDYEVGELISTEKYTGFLTGEWLFRDVIMDTSKRDPEGKPTLIRMTYHPQISLVNVPFMVLPAAGETEEVNQEGNDVILPGSTGTAGGVSGFGTLGKAG